jgi:predicted DNA-binding transcriptional regulator AlpA
MTESRWLDAEAVAKLLRVRASQLPGMVGRGRIPRPSYHLGYRSPRWDRAVLEAAVKDAAMLKQAATARREEEAVAASGPAEERAEEV